MASLSLVAGGISAASPALPELGEEQTPKKEARVPESSAALLGFVFIAILLNRRNRD